MNQISENAIHSIELTNENRRNILQDKMVSEWGNLDAYEKTVKAEVVAYSERNKCSVDEILNSREKIIEVINDISENTLVTLRLNGATGVFAMFMSNTENVFNGIYYRDSNPLMSSNDYSDVSLFAGPVTTARNVGIGLDSYWSEVMKVPSDPNDSTNISIMKPIEIYKNNMKLTSKQVAYWSSPHVVDFGTAAKDIRKCITYVRPLIIGKQIIGVIGVDVLISVLNSYYPSSDFGNVSNTGYMLLQATEEDKLKILNIHGAYLSREFDEKESLSIGKIQDATSYSLNKNSERYEVAIDELKIYDSNTPFEKESWYLSAIGREREIFDLKYTVTTGLILSALISLIVCIILLYSYIKKSVRPIKYIINVIKENQIVDIEKCLRIREFITLSHILNRSYYEREELERKNILTLAIEIISQSTNLRESLEMVFLKIVENLHVESVVCLTYDDDFWTSQVYYSFNVDPEVTTIKYNENEIKQMAVILKQNSQYTEFKKSDLKSQTMIATFAAYDDTMNYIACYLSESGQHLGQIVVAKDSEFSINEKRILCEIANIIAINLKSSNSDAANKAKSEFLSRMSHEIRTPMNAIIGLTKMASDNTDEPVVTDYLTKIDTSSKHLLALINDVLDMSKIESGKLTIERKPFNITSFVETICTIVTPQMSNINFKQNIEIRNADVLGDEYRLRQVLVNLLGNAAKFTPSCGDIILTVKEIDKNRYYFSVKDSGIGIDAKDANKIFNAFEQVDTDKKTAGTGLGLAISRNLISAMGGKIELESELNKGSDFFFTIILEQTEKAVQAENFDEAYDFSGKRILLVEDNEINIEITTYLLTKAKIEVEVAKNGKLGVEKFINSSEDYYDAILMDIQMPVMDGLTATREIRKNTSHKRSKKIPIISMSANAFNEDEKKSLEAGMNASVPKPVDIDLLYRELTKVL
ncbi:hypothetical protein FACS1894132_00660 [Clostridia bacterium]|nr:hypothetical protein FACS1894132_00660 [Clostridia bacterium]